MSFKLLLPIFFLFIVFISFAHGSILYTEDFTGDGDADVSLVGWNGVYNAGDGGLNSNFVWVWHDGDCENLIYTNEYTVDISSSFSIQFQYDLRMNSAYSSTPETSVVVQVGGSWYISKTISVSTSSAFSAVTLAYEPAATNWDTLNVSTASRGSTAAADLSGDITGFGLYSNSQNVGGSCTAEYDNFTITATEQTRTPDFNGSGVVDFRDFADFGSAWASSEGQANFDTIYDLDLDTTIDMDDLVLFAESWLAGALYPYTPHDSPREKTAFNTGWKFYRGDISGDAAQTPAYDDSSWQDVNVPHNPPMNPPNPDPLRPTWGSGYSYEGVSWYRKHFTLDSAMQGKKLFIEFEAANTVADVWVNGTHLTTHYGGYLPFTVDITDDANFGQTENVIAIKVDNTDNADIPIGNEGWFNWGGIYRDVWLHVTNKLHVTDAVYADVTAGGGIFVTYPSVTASQAQVQVKTHVKNDDSVAKNCTLKTFIVDDDNLVVAEATDTRSISAGNDYAFTQTVEVMNPSLWHPHHPSLYTVYTEVYDDDSPVDTYQTRIGIRSISFSKAESFQINGQTYRFRGANRLQDFPYIGYAMGNLGQRRDARLLREAGFEFIRTSHYPQDPAFMEACDEFGILLLDEIPGFQHMGGDTFKQHSYQNMRDMIRRDRNHPCVISWELSLNETGLTTAYADTAVSIGHNEYPGSYISGWRSYYDYDIYICTPTENARSYSGDLPLIIDEYGHWEYNYNGYSDVYRGDVGSGGNFGEVAMLNQILNHQDGLNQNRGMTYLCGDALWVGIDYGPYPQGVLDSFRIPKFSYYFFRSQRDPDLDLSYLGIDSGPMVFIANYWTALSPMDVKVFSNCEQVKLYINDVLQGTRSPDIGSTVDNLQHPPFTFSGLSFQSGELKAEGLIDGQVVATQTVNTPGSPDSISVEFDVTDIPANGSESVFVYASIRDGNGTVVPDASNDVTFSVSGEATLVSPTTVSAEAGIATALLRVTDQPGLITVSATASGLGSDNAAVTSR